MVDILAIGTGLKTAYNIGKAAKDLDDQVRLNTAISEIMDQLTQAQFGLMDMQLQYQQLVDENKELKEKLNKEERFDQYRLFRTAVGHHVYMLKNEFAGRDEPLHAICVQCREDGRRSVLQEGEYSYYCTVCRTEASHKRQPGYSISSGPTYDEHW
ncbi:hypothetical protein RN346_04460 [Halomonas sp. PAMB 3232]|uniref:hypothetical protein n=1 Tax=Halomonas sp. PAMB 3232 TaxID=3075221 RepID=UPI002897EEAA|nr:hypothetical protein [Halomonas sp. PAMB 3232]WNL39814.1 hypothetical protein RN346_04460 [Halomonas sp. PAMB 3232]